MTRPLGWRKRRRVAVAGAVAWALFVLAGPVRLEAPGVAVARPTPRVWRPPVAERGIASYYADWHHGKLTASGAPFDMHAMTAASRTLPLGAVVEVVCRYTQRSVVVLINDRGPYIDGRILDLSYAAAQALGMIRDGLAEVEIYKAKEEV